MKNVSNFKEKKKKSLFLFIMIEIQSKKTIKKSVLLNGKGLHSGENTGIILTPASVNTGIIFEDISSGNIIKGSIENTAESNFYSTNLIKNGILLKVVETSFMCFTNLRDYQCVY